MATFNLANLSKQERQELESFKKECLERQPEVRREALRILDGMKSRGRAWANAELSELAPQIEKAVRIELNLLISAKS